MHGSSPKTPHDTAMQDTISKSKENPKDFAKAHKNGMMRLATVSIGIPLTVLAYLYPLHAFVLPRAIFLCLLVFMIRETRSLLPPAMKPPMVIALCTGFLFPTLAFIAALVPTFAPHQYQLGVFILSFLVLLSSILIVRRTPSNFVDAIVEKISGVLFLLVYPGLIGSYYIMLPNLTNSVVPMLLVTGIVYTNDGFAYLFGRFFGKKGTQPLIYTSQSKTLIGFLGGLIGGGILFAIVYVMKHAYFPGSILKTIIFALLINAAGMLGDLFESALKRSAHCKDSGSIMLGRGGMLDTLDSLLFASSAYYILYPLFY